MQYIHCPLCGADESEVVFRKASLNKDATNVICKQCGLVYMNPQATPAECVEFHKEEFLDSKHLKEVGHVVPKLKTSDLAIKKTIVAFLSEFIGARTNIVDIGCGFGALLDILKKEKNANVFGVELGNLDVKVAKEYYGLDVFHGSLEEFAAKEENNARFDIVIMHHVLEHLPEPLIALAQIQQVLRPRGTLYIGVPNVLNIKKRPEDFFQTFHVLNFSPYSLKRLLERAGFGIVKFNVNAGLPGGMEAAAQIGVKSIETPELAVGAKYQGVMMYVKKTATRYGRLRTVRDWLLFFLPAGLRIKAGRLLYLFLKHGPFKWKR